MAALTEDPKVTEFLVLSVDQQLAQALFQLSSFSLFPLGVMTVLRGTAGDDTLELLDLSMI